MIDRLIYRRTLKDGRVEAVNTWPNGFQELVYPSIAAFETARKAVETRGEVPCVLGFAAVSERCA